ncbi:MAG: ATP-dependent Clp protease adapter ClpS [Verrucomicrobiaceae bacterium]|nr:ATP-dependent Clp protease adapter ClpS [Verrucomicrobiaceae bacterium]
MNVKNANIEVEAAPVSDTAVSDSLAAPWQVLIFDDPVNLMSFVTMVIRRIFGYSEQKSTDLMLQVHQKGRAIVWTGDREKAELFVQQLQSYQLLAAMEPVE